jgi:hypothetical protein
MSLNNQLGTNWIQSEQKENTLLVRMWKTKLRVYILARNIMRRANFSAMRFSSLFSHFEI